MTEELNLLPCPFCGGTNIVISDYAFRGDGEDQFPQDIVCMDCPAGFCGHDFKGKGLARIVSAWNRRPAPAPGDRFAGGGNMIPDGFALVPVRPTTAMLDVAVSFALMVKLSSGYNWTQYMTDVWARMVGAAMAQGEKSQFERLEKAKQAIKDCE